jgi:hypothetical protein
MSCHFTPIAARFANSCCRIREAREIVEPTKQALDKITRVAGFWIAGVRMPADRV